MASSFAYAGFSLETNSDDALSDSAFEALMKETEDSLEDDADKSMRTLGEKRKEKEQKSNNKETADTISKDFLFGLGLGFGSGLNILKNNTGELTSDLNSSTLTARVGLILNDTDLFYQLAMSKINKTQDMLIHELHAQYRFLTLGESIGFYINGAFGFGNLTTTSSEVSGVNFQAGVGSHIHMGESYMIDIGLSKNTSFWEYPVEGVVNYFNENRLLISLEMRL
jgi:hypothetical protein